MNYLKLIVFFYLIPQLILNAKARDGELVSFKVDRAFNGKLWLQPVYISFNQKEIVYLDQTPQENTDYKAIENSSLLPPLVDAHQHLGLTDPNLGASYKDAFIFTHQLPHQEKVNLALSTLNDYLHKGFLYIRDLGGDSAVINEVEKKIENLPYPYVQWVTKPIAQGNGQCPQGLYCSRYFQESFNSHLKTHRTLKIYLDNDPFPGKINPQKLKSLIEKNHLNRPMAFHGIYDYDYHTLVPFLEEQDSIEHLTFIDPKKLDKLKKSKVRLVPTDWPQSFMDFYKERLDESVLYDKKDQVKRMKLLKPYLKQICYGSDFFIDPQDIVRTRAFWALEGFLDMAKHLKLTPLQALPLITGQCNSLFPNQKNLGRLRVNDEASFIIVTGDLSKNLSRLHNIKYVIKQGELVVKP